MTTDLFIPPAAEGLPLAALDSATAGASALDAWASRPYGRNVLAHALVQLARDGWLRTEPGEGFEPVRDRETPEPADEPAPAVSSPLPDQTLRDRLVAAIKASPFDELRTVDYAPNGPLLIKVKVDDLADTLMRRLPAVLPPPADRSAVSAALWAAAEHHTVAEWICCDPIDPKHTLCVQGGAALRMLKALLVDDPDAWKPAPLLDEVMAFVAPGGSATDAHRLALSQALDLGTGAPWEAIHERVQELRRLAAEAQQPDSRKTGTAFSPGEGVHGLDPYYEGAEAQQPDTETPGPVHAVPLPGSNGISSCCGRPPCEFVGERVTRDPEKVTCPGPAVPVQPAADGSGAEAGA